MHPNFMYLTNFSALAVQPLAQCYPVIIVSQPATKYIIWLEGVLHACIFVYL